MLVDLLDNSENHFRSDQWVDTRVVAKLRAAIDELLDPNVVQPGLGTAIGPSGIGKTIALQIILADYPIRPHTGFSEILFTKMRPKSTGLAFARTLISALRLDDDDRDDTHFSLEDLAVRCIKERDIRLVVVDEADQHNSATLEVARYIFNETGRPFLFVGTEELEKTLASHEKFIGRVTMPITLSGPTADEIATKLLPALRLEHWSYSPQFDEPFGKWLWELTKPSVRILVTLLGAARRAAIAADVSQITENEVRMALKHGHWKDAKERLEKLDRSSRKQSTPPKSNKAKPDKSSQKAPNSGKKDVGANE